MGNQFRVASFDVGGVNEEVEALAASLDILKTQANNAVIAHKHSMNKAHSDDPNVNSFDPAVKYFNSSLFDRFDNWQISQISHFLEEEFIEPASGKIREMAGHLNVLARMARDDNTKAMGLHLFDSALA